ncbi:DUF2854 domain-containing protein [Oscillatoria sp. FACHB-1407]|uniref:DUF2854 domain-containing protein n=1 Tax=Oscillatoria sp. FACHB-1407 TaxID=2692847 RepID=UPI001689588F|nr:DUF2854 domain-containing protein [Oscillatoria sp. FACHB-1407]MBD2463889.1 DUF2854 domain-containing protein [Oscillatoria sp. FACHB-1407]
MLGKVSLGTVGLVVGGLLTVVGFVAYFSQSATLNLIGFFYGIPLLLGGLALKAAELEPVPYAQPTSPDVLALREQQATSTQNQIRKDVTRYRYGQSAHLDSSLSHLGLSPNDEERPTLQAIHETAIAGAYALILEFESPAIPFETWQQKRDKMETFFGPGLRVELSQPDEEQINVALIAIPETSPVTA